MPVNSEPFVGIIPTLVEFILARHVIPDNLAFLSFNKVIDYPELRMWLTCTAHGKNTAKIPNQQNAKFGPYLHDRK